MSKLVRQRALVRASACVHVIVNCYYLSLGTSSNPGVLTKARYILSCTGEAEVRDNV